MSVARPLVSLRLASALLAFSFTWLLLAPPASARQIGSAVPTQPGVSSAPAQTATSPEIAVLEPPLVPGLFGPAALRADRRPSIAPPGPERAGLTRGLIPLFISYAALQALDVHSTLTVVDRGGSERNAVMAALVGRPAAFVALKAAITTGTLVAANHLSKRSRVAAYALMIGANSAYAIVVAHNYGLASRLR
jgi:hypothetical protein